MSDKVQNTDRRNSLTDGPYVLHGVITGVQRGPNCFLVQVADCDVAAYALIATQRFEPAAPVIVKAPADRWTGRLMWALACADMTDWVGEPVLFMLEPADPCSLIAIHLDLDFAREQQAVRGNYYITSLAGS